jgi:hypothetical protein
VVVSSFILYWFFSLLPPPYVSVIYRPILRMGAL